jgi:arylsulfatase A-like enzyme
MTKVGMPWRAKEGWQKTDVTMATVMKSLGYATGQFGKNHQGDRDEHLPTMHGFDEFLGNLYHLNAEEEPENATTRRHGAAQRQDLSNSLWPRGVLRCKADGKGGQNDRRHRAAHQEAHGDHRRGNPRRRQGIHQRQTKAGKPFFCWWNGTRMHFRTHVKEEHRHRRAER